MPASTNTLTSNAEDSISNNAANSWSSEARWLQSLTLLWLALGLLALASASLPVAQASHSDGLYFFKRQLGFATVGLGGMAVITRIEMRHWFKACGVLYVAALLLVLATHTGLGVTINGATRWLQLGMRVQPSEFLKPLLILQAGVVFGRWYTHPTWYRALWVSLFGIGMGAVLTQPDLGTTAICGMALWLMALVGGVTFRTLFSTVCLGASTAALSIFLNPYQLARVKALFLPTAEAQADNYQVVQSLIAIGSGGIWGLGFGLSRQKLYYLPIQFTDFIFSVYAEEFGAVGTIGFIILLVAFTILTLRVAELCTDLRLRLVAYGCLFLLVGQAAINIGVVSSLLPTTGVTLPLFSYGGSSVLASIVSAGFLIRVARECRRTKTTSIVRSLHPDRVKLPTLADRMRILPGKAPHEDTVSEQRPLS
ncbi:MAG: putative peptidoglycan glycosyltransferase FtsW [Cyanobacteria bacterium P01_A01_bin.3]